MRLVLSFLLIFSTAISFAQTSAPDITPEQVKEAEYEANRERLTIPPYGLTKIRGMIEKIKYNEDEESRAMDKKTYEALTLREKFTYNMIHGESYSQNCDVTLFGDNQSKKIFAYMKDMFDEYSWSDRQSSFFASNRDSVISLMKESITRTKKVGLNFKYAILEIDAKEMIPFLIEIYKAPAKIKDLDILTVLLLMMKQHEYEGFINTGMYRKLYGEEAMYVASLNYNKANEDLIIKRVMDFYNANK